MGISGPCRESRVWVPAYTHSEALELDGLTSIARPSIAAHEGLTHARDLRLAWGLEFGCGLYSFGEARELEGDLRRQTLAEDLRLTHGALNLGLWLTLL